MREPGRRPRVLKTKEEGLDVAPGALFEIHSGGGGGWGDPAERGEDALARDKRDGLGGEVKARAGKAAA